MDIDGGRYNVQSESGGFHTHCYECDDFSWWSADLHRIVELIEEHESSVHAGE